MMTSEIIQASPDPVINQRIAERRQQIQNRIDDIDYSIHTIGKWQTAHSLPQRLVRVLTGRREVNADNDELNPEFIKLLQDPDRRRELSGRLSGDIGILTYNFENAAREVEEQIRANRRSHQLYWLRQFLGDPVKPEELRKREIIPYYDYPYDGGRRDKTHGKVNEESRLFRSIDEVVTRCREVIKQGGRSITLYDTSIPQVQARHAVVIDALERFGFSIDEGLKRSRAVMAADSGINPHALDEFSNRSPDRPAHRFLRDDWIVSSGKTAKGYIRLEGHQYDTRSDSNKKLIQLCREWNIPNLIVELSYERTAKDMRLTLDLHREQVVIDAYTISPSSAISMRNKK